MNRDLRWWLLSTLVWLTPLLCCANTYADQTVARFSFESGVDGWVPRADSVSVTQVQATGATPTSAGVLHVTGGVKSGWNYAASRHLPAEPGKLYRLTVWLRVDRLGRGTPAPYLKCEFVADAGRAMAGQVRTDSYDPARLGSWQKLQSEFKAPANAASLWLALEKGTSGPTQIDAQLDEIQIEQIDRLSVIEQYRLKPWPIQLQNVRGVHPRLFLDQARVAQLRTRRAHDASIVVGRIPAAGGPSGEARPSGVSPTGQL